MYACVVTAAPRRHPPRPRARLPAGGDGVAELNGGIARSPAVGYFTPAAGLAMGQSVSAGDLLGNIDVLGISQEVIAPSSGIVSRVLAEDGQAVEYGQALAEIDPLELELELEASADDPDASAR